MSSHFLGSRNSVCIVVASEEKHLYNDFPTLPLCLSFIAERDVIWYEIFLWLVWVSYPSCVPSQPLAYLQPIGLCWGGGVGEITLMLFEYNSAVAKTLVCYQHHIVTNPKHSIIWAAVRKLRPSQTSYRGLQLQRPGAAGTTLQRWCPCLLDVCSGEESLPT